MEFAHVGSHCFLDGCKQQDFLPFKCEFCGDTHCADHRRPDDHQCRKGGPVDDNYVILCPMCQASLHMKGAVGQDAKTSPELIWNRHVDNGDCDKQ